MRWPPASRTLVLTALTAALAGCGKKEVETSEREGAPVDVAIASPRELEPGEVRKEPLLARAGNDGKTLFDRIPAKESGLDFVHLWQPRNQKESVNISRSFTGGCVALGDIDNDGLPEVFLSRPHGGSKLYRNLGDLRFEDITVEAGIEAVLSEPWIASGTFVDIQGDGLLDLYTCAYTSPNKLFINLGNGRFEERAAEFGLDYSGSSIVMGFADYDRDGDLDGFLLTNRVRDRGRPEKLDFTVKPDGRVVVPEPYRDEIGAMLKPDGELFQYDAGQRDLLYRNDGGKFVEVARKSGIDGYWHGLSATWWDYNSDGWIDLYVANDYYGPDYLYRNNRDGTFTDVLPTTVPYTPWFSMGSDAGDLDGDGRLDYLASDMAATSHYRQKVGMGEMDSEGWFLETATPRQYMRNALYLNTGTDRFLEVAQMTGLSATDWNWAVKIADYDCDGRNDVFFSNGMTRDFFNADVRAKVKKIHDETGVNRWNDFPPLLEQNRLFQNRGDLEFVEVTEEWGIEGKSASFGSAVGDLDGDGDLDLVVNNFTEPVALFRNASTGGNVIKFTLQGSDTNRHAIGAELRLRTADGEQVRLLQPVRGFISCDPAEVVFGLGEETQVQELTIRWPSGKQQTMTDLSAGKHYTIAEAPDAPPIKIAPAPRRMFAERPMSNPPRHRENTFDDFAVQPLLPNRLSLFGPAMAWADIDGNGRPDCFLGGSSGEPAQLWMQGPDGKLFQQKMPAFTEHAAYEDIDATWFDADGDGDLDLYVVSGGIENDVTKQGYIDRLYINLGNGLGTAPEGSLPDTNFSGGCVAAGDVDADGDLDLFVGARVVPGAYPTAPPSRLLLNNGTGMFTDAPTGMAPALARAGMVTDALWSDTDGDGDLDLLVTTEYGPVRCYRNEAGKLAEATEAAGLANLHGWWNCITAGDFDGDGDLDYAVGNFGLNTKYHPTAENPQLLYYGEFEEGEGRNLVEAHLADGQLVPNRGRSCSSLAMPFIAEKFGNYHEFAVADLVKIYSEPKLEKSVRLEANQLASGVLINDGGVFTYRKLPPLAQIAPSFGMAALDANGDQKLDLYVSQNFYGPQRETGRMSAGLGAVLLGDGTGGFRAVSPAESGIVVPEDARGATAMDFDGDGDEDLAVAINNGPLRIFLGSADK